MKNQINLIYQITVGTGCTMFFKTLTLHSLSYAVGVASSIVAAHHSVPSQALDLESNNNTEIFSTQIVNRSLKGSRLPIKQAAPQTKVKELVQEPKVVIPNPKPAINCGPYIDVPGRCFADAKPNQRITQTNRYANVPQGL